MAMFNSYVKLPEGTNKGRYYRHFTNGQMATILWRILGALQALHERQKHLFLYGTLDTVIDSHHNWDGRNFRYVYPCLSHFHWVWINTYTYHF